MCFDTPDPPKIKFSEEEVPLPPPAPEPTLTRLLPPIGSSAARISARTRGVQQLSGLSAGPGLNLPRF